MIRAAFAVSLLLWTPGAAQTTETARQQLDSAAAASRRLASPRSAAIADYRPLSPGSSDFNAIVGEHWLNGRLLGPGRFSFARPAYLMFYAFSGDTVLVGMAYGVGQAPGAPVPEGFDGDADRWHIHFFCTGIPGLGSVLGEHAEDCRALGGKSGESQIAMVHVWVNVDNPDGQFAPFNPALPFVATGLKPPTAQDLSDTRRSRRLRSLALALGETFGATPRAGSLITARRDTAFEHRVAPSRERIRALISELKGTENGQDRKRYDAIADRMIGEWRAIRQAYLDHAGSKALRTIIERWYDVAVDPSKLHAREAGH